MTKIYLVRHAEAEGNLYRRIHGHTDSNITPNGEKQLEALRERFEGVRLDACYTSDLRRAVETAEGLCQGRGIIVERDKRFREMFFGPWEDQTYGEIERLEPECYASFNADPMGWHKDGAEDFEGSVKRFLAAMEQVVKRHADGNIVIVTHGSVLRNALIKLFYGPESYAQAGHSDNTAVSLLESENGAYSLLYANDNSHLSEKISTLAKQGWWKEEPEEDYNLWFKPYDMDRDAYCAMRRDAWQTIYGDTDGLNEQGFYEELSNIMHYHSYAAAYAMWRDEIVGFIQLAPARRRDVGVGYVSFVYICPEYRNKGLGAQLIGYAVSRYRAQNRKALQLGCARCNFHGQHFYEKLGFQVVGTVLGLKNDLLLYQLKM